MLSSGFCAFECSFHRIFFIVCHVCRLSDFTVGGTGDRLLIAVGHGKCACHQVAQQHLSVTQDIHHFGCVEYLSVQMLVGSIRECCFHIAAELCLQLVKFLNQQRGIVVLGNVAILLVLVDTLGSVVLAVGLAVKLILLTVLDSEERCHNAYATQLVLQVHHVNLVAKRCEILTSRCTKSVDKHIHALSTVVSIVDSLLEIVLSPSRTARGVNHHDMSTAVLIVGSLHHPVADLLRAV